MNKWNGARVGKIGGGGEMNGYSTPKAKQEWAVGLTVNVGFLKGLVITAKENGQYKLTAPNGKRYAFEPHMGLYAL